MSTSDLDYNTSGGDLVPGSWDPLAEFNHVVVVEGCGCVACQSLREAGTDGVTSKGGINGSNPEGQNIGQLLNLITNPDGSRSFSGNRNVDATLIGSKWGTQNLTFSFPTSGSNYNGTGLDSNGVNLYHLDLGTQQQAAARAGFAQIAAATGLTFTEIVETDTVHANIRVSQSADNDVASAYGGFPSDTRGVAGDIWFGRTSQPYYDLAAQGTWGFSTMLHEIGHTMGLKHGHQDYTNSDLSFFFGTSPRFGSQSLTPDRDGQAWSLMTYTPAPFTNAGFAGEKSNQPQTFMQYDLAALQYMYGANYTTNASDTVYTWSGTTGEMFINGVGQGAPSGNRILMTLWDGGGNDTIDASNYAGGVTVDLRPGEFVTLDQAQLANHLAYQNLSALAPGNIAMSLLFNNDVRSLIENATGGAGNDIFVGNIANNVLNGGAGSDTVVFTGTTGVTVTLNDTNADVIVNHDGETDTLRSIENIGGTSASDTLTGNSQNNTLIGSGGADTLSGGGGDDRLIGGGFTTTTTFSAPSQADITKAETTNNGSIATAVDTAGAYDVDANPNITNSTSVPHATINATATGGTVEYYRIEVTTAGTQAVFDIDGGGTLDDSILELVNSAGVLLANNDTGTGDAQPPGHDDAFLTYTFATPGTYYIRVGQWTGTAVAQPLTAGMTYQLNISLQGAAVVTTTVTANNTSSAMLNGGEGNDFLLGTIASDTLDGGTGNDTASYVNAFSAGSTTGVTVDLNTQGVVQDTVAAGSDTLTGIENLVGSALNDTLTGNGNDNVIEGGLGDDTLVGGVGSDTASYAGAAAGVSVNLALQGAGQNTVNGGMDTLGGFENLQGSAFNDGLTGDASANTLSGGAGDDTLDAGANAAGAVDLLDGGIGADTATFAGQTAALAITLNGGADGVASVGGVTIANLRSIENLLGGAGADIITGDFNANVIDGGLGDDLLNGGTGVDTVSFASNGATSITVDLGLTTAQVTGVGSKTIVNVENVRTGTGADTVTGDANDNVLFDGGGGGNDTYNGGAGSDTVDYAASTSSVIVNLNTATAQNTGTFGGSDTLANIENVVGAAAFANSLIGNASANRLVGGAVADFLVAGAGNDVVVGGAGNDNLFGDNNGSLSAQEGADVLEGGAGIDFVVGGQGNDTLRGGDGDDQLVGGVASTTAVFTNDGGQDTFDGGEGADIAYAYYTDQTGGIAFDLANLAGNSAITMAGVAAGSFTSIERIIFRGGSGADTVKGSGTLDTLVGNAGNDILDGWYGNDSLSGGLGDDTLIGGEGLDTATYVNSTAGVTVDLRLEGVAQGTGGEGVDILVGIEYLTGSAFGDTLRGNDEFNLIVDNAVSAASTALSQTDSLFGYGGNDSLLVTRAAAAVATNINLDGGDGNDFIEVRSGALSANLAANGAGLSTATYAALGATSNDRNLDVVIVDGGAGNDRIVLTGVASAVVNAGSGADIVSISMRGVTTVNNYQVSLGTGADILQLGVGVNAAASTDVAATARTNRVTDFEVGNAGDRFEMSNFLNLGLLGYAANSDAFASGNLRLVQSGTDLLLQVDRDGTAAVNAFVTVFTISNGYTGGFTAFNFDGFIGSLTLSGFATNETITGATADDVLSGNGGNDVLNGLAGNDTLDGGAGDDLLRGGAGDDILIGGAGNDTASFSDATAGVMVDLELAGAQATGAGSDTLSGIENLTGSAFDDTLIGDAGVNVLSGGEGDDVLNGRTGNDTLIGGVGNDLFLLGEAGDVVTELTGEGTDTVRVSFDYTLDANVENLQLIGAALNGTGNELNNKIFGNAGNNTLIGGAGSDTLMGFGGDDTLIGGTGDDFYFVDEAGDRVIEASGEGYDTVFTSTSLSLEEGLEIEALRAADAASTAPLNLRGNAFNQIVTGNDGINNLYGMAGEDYLEGRGGNDVLDGGTDADVLLGGSGDDFYIVDNSGDRTLEAAGEGFDTVFTSASLAIDAGSEIEALRAADAASTVAINLRGNEFGQIIAGNAGANNLFGMGGEDYLEGRGGSDKLDGGTGADVLRGGTGDDFYIADDSGDRMLEAAGEGFDTVFTSSTLAIEAGSEVEALRAADGASTVAINLFGNEFGQIMAGNDGTNLLSGAGGEDYLEARGGDDKLDGGAGNDVLIGGTGEDIFAFGEIGFTDRVIDFVSGTDRIDLSGIDAVAGTSDDDAFTFIGAGAFTNVAGQLRSFSSGGVNYLAGDVDGNGVGDFLIDLGSTQVVTNDILV